MAQRRIKKEKKPLVSVIMGSQSDWETMEHATKILEVFHIPFETKIMSAHRTLGRVTTYGENAAERGLKVILAGAGGAAALPGLLAALTTIPVLGVPMATPMMGGLDSLLSMAQMPGGIPVGTLAVGKAGAKNAALLAVSILALSDKELAAKLVAWRAAQAAAVSQAPVKAPKNQRAQKAKGKKEP
ncbi:MAG: 5-(carboxyamino)imidazole ribonucleotide mutase [Alphaproteobacteria bacterium]|nr:5-(carboxyamino)imidazole ribonucleotide mutase [Alphaproteobacteria bacterium]